MIRFSTSVVALCLFTAISASVHAGGKKAPPVAAPPPFEVIQWSSASWIPGLYCTKFEAPADPDGWNDNFLCSTRDLKLRWSYNGLIDGMVCTHIFEGSDPDGWSNNYLCSPQDYGFKWSFDKPIAGMQCLQINEPKDSHAWGDNFLCWPRSGPLKAVPAPPANGASLLNLLRAKSDYQSYLAVGLGKREENFDLVATRIKLSVDERQSDANFQLTPDEFFAQNKLTFDLISVRGLHDADQAERAVANALKILRPGGTIVVSDCNPTSEDQQRVPASGAESWMGDVWKAWVKLMATREDLKMVVVNLETGLGVITRGKQGKVTLPAKLSYEALAGNRKQLLNLVEPVDFVKGLRGK
jgi:SAM-dependent methyltransferase